MKIIGAQLIQNNGNYSYSCNYKLRRNPLFINQNYMGGLSSDVVSFGTRENPAEVIAENRNAGFSKCLSTIKEIKDLPCIYCGEPMMPASMKSRLALSMANARGEELAEKLLENRKYLKGIKRNIAQKIATAAIKYPDENIQEILTRLAPVYKAELEQEQLEVLRNIRKKYSGAFNSDIEKKLFQSILYETTQWINNESDAGVFKRKTFLHELKNILYLPVFRNRSVIKKIISEAEKMPQSFESESAFMVKYYRRSPREIVEQLFYEATSTLEHIKPRTAGGVTAPHNLAVACARCNNLTRNNIPMTKFVDMHPEIVENIKKNLRAILNDAKKPVVDENSCSNPRRKRAVYNKMVNDRASYKDYVSAIARTFQQESEGKISLKEFIKE